MVAVTRDRGAHDAAHDLLERTQTNTETFGVGVETHVIFSHRTVEEVFDAARVYGADITVIGWGEASYGSPGRAESAIDELAYSLPCDFLVFRDRGFDPSRILVPTAGGPDSDLSAAIAKMLRAEFGSEITLLHVAEDATMLVIGATERGLLSWVVRGSLVLDVLNDVECSVLMAETERERSLIERLFGARWKGNQRDSTSAESEPVETSEKEP